MTKLYLHQIKLLFQRLSICFLVYFICRLALYVAQHDSFANTGLGGLLELSVYGLRFDAFSIAISNSLFLVLSLLPINGFFSRTYQRTLYWIFMITNGVFTAFNCIDVVYFKFTHKRSDADLFNQLGGQSDMLRLIPRFFMDFWWAILFFALLLWLMRFLYRRTLSQATERYAMVWSKAWWSISALFLLVAGFGVLAARGGLQRVPISLVNAGEVAKPADIPLVVNTPFTIIKSSEGNPLPELHFFDKAQLSDIYSPYHHFDSLVPNRKNLVVIILESFSKEYTKLGRKKSLTPFLDSLMDHSMLFENGFANGTKSIEGIPAILSGLPSLMDLPVINSRYAGNKQYSLAYLLGKEGYHTAFFHGGINGTMNFDSWAKIAGYNEYYGKDEYPNPADFDNFWGIWDEPYLSFCAKKISSFKEPFHAALFTLSSHHPYFVPEKYKGRFPKTELENSESIGYADYALRRFFEEAKKTSWYRNTIFALVADHTSLSVDPYFAGQVGMLNIPIMFYNPDNSLTSTQQHVFSQMDMLPTSLELLGYNKPFFAFGNTYRSAKQHVVCFYYNDYYYQYTDSMLFIYHNHKTSHVYNYLRDSLTKGNLLGAYPELEASNLSMYRAFVQVYNHTLLKDSAEAGLPLPIKKTNQVRNNK